MLADLSAALLANLLSPAVLFFVLGVIATVGRSDLRFPEPLYTALTIYLPVAIGFKGGVALSKALFTEIVDTRLTKAQILGLMRRVVDLGLNYRFTPDDLRGWPGRILLLMGDDDPATPKAARKALAEMYPRAEVRNFVGAGHLTAILKQDNYFAAMDEFLSA